MKRLPIAVCLAVIAAAFVYQQTNSIKTSRYTWQSSRVPRGFDGYRIVQVSDLHSKRFGRNQERLLRAIRKAQPDMIAFTGDFIDYKTKSLDSIMDLLAGIRGMAPVYYVDGNHDPNSPYYQAFRAMLSQYDVTVLHGWARLAHKDETVSLVGFPYWDFPYWDWKPSNVPDSADIVLSHSPDLFAALAGRGCGLVLAGHNHGGQIAFPGGKALFGPRKELLPAYSAGIYREGDATMVLSRGLGVSQIPFRLFAQPEIVVIELKTE